MSPEQIAGRLKVMKVISLHHETIYQYVLADKRQGGQLYTYLRPPEQNLRKRYGSAHNRTGIPNRRDIDQQPAEANNRTCVGHWEADTIIGNQHQGAIVSLDERKSKLRLAAQLPRKKASYTTEAINNLFEPIKKHVKTITFDNGKEFTQHEKKQPVPMIANPFLPNSTILEKVGRMKMPMACATSIFPEKSETK